MSSIIARVGGIIMFSICDELYFYDIYPKVFRKNVVSTITIKPQGGKIDYENGKNYRIDICALEKGNHRYPNSSNFKTLNVKYDDQFGFKFTNTFEEEMMYFIRIIGVDGKKHMQLSVYCVDYDLVGRYPFIGDLHIHTSHSDGRESPAMVCANYRAHGYDFMVISDHARYYPSLEAINAYKGVKTGLNIVPGEEVHMPDVDGIHLDFHMVNFGGEYSINALTETETIREKGTDKKFRSLTGKCPEYMELETWREMIKSIASTLDVPEGVNSIQAAAFKWIHEEIGKANGLSIFPHPTWINDVYHVPEIFNDYVTKMGWFDAFEVLGGENYFEQNGFQTLKYYEDRAKGINYPIVGSTDSHSSLRSNRNAFICSTIVFAQENEKDCLIKSIKDFYSVAIDTISTEFRVVGSNRLARYVTFLLKNYFPLHDELCFEEGRAMRQYSCGPLEEKEKSIKILDHIGNRLDDHRKKYFDF